jgi:hypothetical protein
VNVNVYFETYENECESESVGESESENVRQKVYKIRKSLSLFLILIHFFNIF